MQTVLIAHRDPAYAEQLASDLRQAGFRVIDCGGPWPPLERCIRCDRGYCPLTESADLMIYDARLTALDEYGTRYNLAVDSARAHPEVPLLVDWSPDGQPDPNLVRELKETAPNVHAAVRDRAALLEEVKKLLAAQTSPGRSPVG
jgi:hypothetical protein